MHSSESVNATSGLSHLELVQPSRALWKFRFHLPETYLEFDSCIMNINGSRLLKKVFLEKEVRKLAFNLCLVILSLFIWLCDPRMLFLTLLIWEKYNKSLVTCTFLPANSMLLRGVIYGTSLLPLESIVFVAYGFCCLIWFVAEGDFWVVVSFSTIFFFWLFVCFFISWFFGFWFLGFLVRFLRKSYIYFLCQL